MQLLLIGTISPSPPVPTVTEADLKQVDIQEGYQVDLAPGSALQCVVSFAPGQERRVYFAGAALIDLVRVFVAPTGWFVTIGALLTATANS